MLSHTIVAQSDQSPMPPPSRHLGALSDADRWQLVVENIAELLADGDRAAKGLPVGRFHQLPADEQAYYRRHALIGAMPLMAPEFVAECRDAAILRAAEAYLGDAGDLVPPKCAARMRAAWIWGSIFYNGCLDGTVPPANVVHKASELRLIVAPTVKERIQ